MILNNKMYLKIFWWQMLIIWAFQEIKILLKLLNKINIENKIHTFDKIKIELIKENQTYNTNFIFKSIK